VNDRKSKFLLVRFTPEQYALFSKIAHAYGRSMSTIIRDSALRGIINQETLTLVSKKDLAEACGLDVALIDYILESKAPPTKAAQKPGGVAK